MELAQQKWTDRVAGWGRQGEAGGRRGRHCALAGPAALPILGGSVPLAPCQDPRTSLNAWQVVVLGKCLMNQ